MRGNEAVGILDETAHQLFGPGFSPKSKAEQ